MFEVDTGPRSVMGYYKARFGVTVPLPADSRV